MRLLLALLALALLPGCAYWTWDSTEYKDGRVEMHVTEMWICTRQTKFEWKRGKDCYHPVKTVDMDTGVFGIQCSMQSDSEVKP